MPLTIGNLLASARPLGIAGALLALAWFAAIGDSQEQAGTPPKIVLLFDVSASMNTVDGPVPTGVDPATLPSRQEQVVRLLTAKGKKGVPAFLDRLVQKAPVVAYRFGSSLDNVTDPDPDKPWSADEWRRWLKSDDRTGTNIAGAALRMLREEKDNSIQAIIIVSDGRSNHSTAAQIKEFLAEVNGAKPPIPVFTVGVGNPKPAPSIRIADLHAPETARPGQRFVVRVPIDSHGLANEQIPITLEASRVNDALGKPISGKKQSVPGPKTAQLKADGPTLVDFEIDLPALHKNAAPVDLLGTWQFTARTPRYPREAFTGAEHVSEPTSVVVQERKTRVLLFSGGPSREYQFLRTLLVREVRENRLDLSVLLQTGQDDGVEQEVDGDKLLKRFPDKLAGVYDVILSFDPDWTTLTAKQLKTLHEWVDRHGGGLLFSAGKVNTYRLARPGGIDLSSLLPLVPVVLMDSRLHGLGLMEPDATRPYPLRFASDLKAYPFLQLDEDLPGPTAGWNSFFWNNEKYEYDPAKADRPRRGFFTYYPVERIRPAATVVAGFAGPKESRIGERSDAFKDQQAFIVTMPFGAGKSMYLSAGEFWRLRQAKEGYHERFWLGIVRYLTAPPLKGRPFGQVLMTRSALAGAVAIEAQVLDPEQKPLAADRQVRADVRDVRSASAVPQIIDLHPAANKPGWYVGQAPLKKAGDYAVRIAAGADDAFTHRLTIRELESELDDVRVDFGHLQQLASNAGPVLKTLKADARKDVEAALKRSAELESARLFFRLEEAHALVNCLEKAPAKKGAKAEAPKPIQPMQSAFKDKKTLKVLLIDGAGAAGLKNLGDTHCIKSAIQCIPDNLYESVLAHDLPGCRDQPAQALERDDLAQFGAILLLNVPRLQPKQVANLERFSRAGGGVAFFLGPRVDAPRYNATLYRDGKGIFPVPLAPAYHPAAAQKPREETPGNVDQLLLRDDLFPELDRYPILGAVFSERQSRDVLKHLTIGRYFQVPRRTWKKTPGRSFELATLPNDAPANTQAARVAALTQGPLRALSADPTKKTYRPLLERHRDAIENTVRAGSEKRCIDLANAIENCLLDRQLAEFWKSPEPKVRALFIDLAKLRHEARHGDPLIVGGAFGRGRVVAVMTSAGTQWNDFAAGSVASLAYAPFIWETLNYVTHQDGPAFVSGRSSPKGALPPLFLGVDLGFAATTAFNGKDELKALGPIYLVSADASLPFVGTLYSAAGLSDARWEVDVRPMPIAAKKALKNPPMPFTLTVPMEMFQDRRRRRALDELTLQSLGAVMPPRLPDGFSPAHSLSEEVRFDFRKHLGRLKGKNDEPQPEYLVKLSIVATSAGAKAERASRSFYFLIVSNNELAMQAHAGNDDEADRLHRAREKVERSQVLLDEQIARLQSPNTDADTVGVRVAQIRREMDNAAAHAAEASGRLDRLHAEFQINRIDLGNLTAGTSGSADLRKVIHDDDVGFRKAERDLHHVSEALDKNQRENALTGARAARKNLADLRDALAKAAIRMDEGVVELKLIKLLTEIERRQRGVSAELDQRWVEFRRLAIEELLKGSPKDKK